MKKLILITVAMLVVCLLALVACSGPSSVEEMSEGMWPEPAIEEEAYYRGSGDVLAADEERMIVRTGDMSLVVEDVVGARDEIVQLAADFGGYVVSSRISGEDPDKTGWISIRVPDTKFDDALAELRELAVRVTSESTDSQDVTEEYTDLEARLRNAEATESQYLALLEKAEDVEDTLKIYESLSQVRSEIEQIEGRMQYLERITSMSLISISLRPEATAKPLVRAGWNAWEIVKSAVRGIVVFGQWLVAVAIWLLIFIPVWGTVLGIIYWRRRRKRRQQS
jgi:hypothetical protein